jgi:hypothetical protein
MAPVLGRGPNNIYFLGEGTLFSPQTECVTRRIWKMGNFSSNCTKHFPLVENCSQIIYFYIFHVDFFYTIKYKNIAPYL